MAGYSVRAEVAAPLTARSPGRSVGFLGAPRAIRWSARPPCASLRVQRVAPRITHPHREAPWSAAGREALRFPSHSVKLARWNCAGVHRAGLGDGDLHISTLRSCPGNDTPFRSDNWRDVRRIGRTRRLSLASKASKPLARRPSIWPCPRSRPTCCPDGEYHLTMHLPA